MAETSRFSDEDFASFEGLLLGQAADGEQLYGPTAREDLAAFFALSTIADWQDRPDPGVIGLLDRFYERIGAKGLAPEKSGEKVARYFEEHPIDEVLLKNLAQILRGLSERGAAAPARELAAVIGAAAETSLWQREGEAQGMKNTPGLRFSAHEALGKDGEG